MAFLASTWQVVGGLGATVIVIWRIWNRIRCWIAGLVENVVNEIRVQTYPIQKHANGGDSLPDATKMLKAIIERQTEIGDRTARIEGALGTHLDWHNGGMNGN